MRRTRNSRFWKPVSSWGPDAGQQLHHHEPLDVNGFPSPPHDHSFQGQLHVSFTSACEPLMASVESRDKAFRLLCELKARGSCLPGDSGSDPRILPEWVDKSKLLRAKEVSDSSDSRTNFSLMKMCPVVQSASFWTLLQSSLGSDDTCPCAFNPRTTCCNETVSICCTAVSSLLGNIDSCSDMV